MPNHLQRKQKRTVFTFKKKQQLLYEEENDRNTNLYFSSILPAFAGQHRCIQQQHLKETNTPCTRLDAED